MSGGKKTEFMRCRTNVINYLFKRSIIARQDNSQHFTYKLFDTAKDLYKKNLIAHFGCVNAIEFSADGNLLFSGGDDRRLLMWNINSAMMHYTGEVKEVTKPCIMKACHYSNIFCLAVDDQNKRVLSGSNDDQVIVHDYVTGNLVDIFLHESPVFSLSLHPSNGNIFASAADNGRILIYDVRESNADLVCLAKLRTPFYGVMFNPNEPSLLATANSKVGIHIWDLRKPKEILIKCSDEPSMAVRWNQKGTILLALRNLLPIVIYDPLIPQKKLEFDSRTYFNACTMKSCSFAGDNDEYILSGSDDFNLYMWKIPEPWPESEMVESEHLALTGHRSIVNQVRYNSRKQLIATSGVEKIIKIWSPFRFPYSEGDRDKPSAKRHRALCSSKTCVKNPGFLSHDYSQESVEEDTRMIHFFDSLLQNELNDMTCLPHSQPFYFDANLFTLSNRKNQTKLYEKLIKKKKKYLSKVLVDKGNEKKVYCSLNRSVSNIDKGNSLPSFSNSSSLENNNTQTLLENIDRDVPVDGVTPIDINKDSKNILFPLDNENSKTSPSNTSGDTFKNSEQMLDLAACSEQSKASLTLNLSDTEDSKKLFTSKSISNNLNKLKEAEVNLSSSSNSNQLESCHGFKRKHFKTSRCYRNSMKRKRITLKESDSDNILNENSVDSSREDEETSGNKSLNFFVWDQDVELR